MPHKEEFVLGYHSPKYALTKSPEGAEAGNLGHPHRHCRPGQWVRFVGVGTGGQKPRLPRLPHLLLAWSIAGGRDRTLQIPDPVSGDRDHVPVRSGDHQSPVEDVNGPLGNSQETWSNRGYHEPGRFDR